MRAWRTILPDLNRIWSSISLENDLLAEAAC
jgi:hypothetical protein